MPKGTLALASDSKEILPAKPHTVKEWHGAMDAIYQEVFCAFGGLRPPKFFMAPG
jgi:hypothetical protein